MQGTVEMLRVDETGGLCLSEENEVEQTKKVEIHLLLTIDLSSER